MDGIVYGKIPDGAIESAKVDPDNPLYVHTLIKFALRKVGMGQDEADRYAAAHQQQAVDAYRGSAQAVRDLHERREGTDGSAYCDLCSNHGDITWPCATIRALDSTEQ